MKTFKQIVNEVAQPRAGDEIEFKEKHIIQVITDPNAEETQFQPTTKKFVNKADYKKGEDKAVYESKIDDDEDEKRKHNPKLMELLRRKQLELRKKVIDEEIVIPEEILATERNAFYTAAKNAHKSGSSHFNFAGKKYPVTMKHTTVKALSEGKDSPEGGEYGDKEKSHVDYKKANQSGKTKQLDELDSEGLRKFYKRFRKDKEEASKNESEELTEISKKLAKSYLDKSKAEREANSVYPTREKFRGRMIGGATADAKLKGRVEEPYKFGAAPKRKMRVKIAATNEEVLSEGVSKGDLKLKDGSSVMVSDKDAKLLNDLLNGLNSANKKKMQTVMMTDKAGFQEILGFAREAN